jgi:stage II sporulation protein D
MFLCALVLIGCRKKVQAPGVEHLLGLENQPTIRVLLVNDVASCLFSTEASFTITAVGSDSPQMRFDSNSKALKIEVIENKISFDGWSSSADSLQIIPDANEIFILNGRRYRGSVRIDIGSEKNTLDVINTVGIEPYLAGVIGAEMPSYWEPQALEAQAIAARTYCLSIKNNFGDGRHWDVRRTAANQVYQGVAGESPAVWKAIEKTAGRVLVYVRSDGSEDIFPAYYSSTCAGHTENSKNVFGDEHRPLAGVKCEYCLSVAKKEYVDWPTVYMTKEQVNEKLIGRYPQLSKLGSIEKISVLSKSEYGNLTRLTWIKLEGKDGVSDTVRAEDFRLALDPSGSKIKSAAFRIQTTGNGWAFADGKGFGHGVGMCQSGAQGLARKGQSTWQILSYYYPDSQIKKLY